MAVRRSQGQGRCTEPMVGRRCDGVRHQQSQAPVGNAPSGEPSDRAESRPTLRIAACVLALAMGCSDVRGAWPAATQIAPGVPAVNGVVETASRRGTPTPTTAAPRRYLTSGGWTAAELRAVAEHLRDRDPSQRRAAIESLTGLQPDSLPAIGERVAQLHAEMHSGESLAEVVRAWEASPPPPTVEGYREAAARLLARRRGDDARALVEALSLLQAFTHMPSTEAGLQLSEWVDLYDGVLRPSLDELMRRDGLARLPALLRLRSHPDPTIKRWAQSHLAALGIAAPATALDVQDPGLLADIVTAYSVPLDFGAMPLVVRETAHPSALVRDAARAAVERYGRNAIWQVRESYEEWTGRSLPEGLPVAQARRLLYAAIDSERTHHEVHRIEAANRVLASGDHVQARAQYDAILAHWPSELGAEAVVRAQLAVADDALARDELGVALSALQVALFLTPIDHDAHAEYAAELKFVQAEYDLTRGIADTSAYQQVLAVHPDHAGAQAALAQLTQHHRGTRRAFLFASLSMLSLLAAGGFLIAWRLTLKVPEARRTTGARAPIRLERV